MVTSVREFVKSRRRTAFAVVSACPLDSALRATYVEHMTYDETLDAIGLLCPLPVLKARKRLKSMLAGQVLRLEATDPAAVIDVPHFCSEQGHEFLGDEAAQMVDLGGDQAVTHYFIRKG